MPIIQAPSTLTAFEALRICLLEKGNLNPPFEKVQLEILQLDWEKAKTLQVERASFSFDQVWKTMLDIGFCKASVLPLVDPAIVPIVERLLGLGALPTASCSSHPWQGAELAWVALIFRDATFGRKFCHACEIASNIFDVKVEINPFITRLFGSFGSRMSLEDCLTKQLPMTISSLITKPKDARKFWYVFSRVLNLFDAKGTVKIDCKELEHSVSDHERPEFLREVWEKLWLGKSEMSKTRFAVLPYNNPPLGLPDKYGLLESLEQKFPPTVFYTKKAWPLAIEKVNLELSEQRLREREVIWSDLTESIPELDHLVKQGRLPRNKHLM